eukprot:COSAG04_NODE_9397_length_867_cov_1.679688_2_plen_177_part_00
MFKGAFRIKYAHRSNKGEKRTRPTEHEIKEALSGFGELRVWWYRAVYGEGYDHHIFTVAAKDPRVLDNLKASMPIYRAMSTRLGGALHFLPAEADDDVADALREFTLSFRGRDSYLDGGRFLDEDALEDMVWEAMWRIAGTEADRDGEKAWKIIDRTRPPDKQGNDAGLEATKVRR